MTLYRVTLDGDALRRDVEYQGMITDTVPDALGFAEIEWHDIGDKAPLESWTAGAQTAASEQASPGGGTAAEAALPAEEGRIVFYGNIGEYSYEEVVALQRQPDPNSQWADTSRTYRLIVLDTPQEMELRGEDGLWSSEVRLIDVSHAEGLEPYDGQHLIFSVDPYNTYYMR